MEGGRGDDFNPNEHPHVRFNPLKNEWVLVSPHRMKRPWSGQIEPTADEIPLPEHDATNPLCPGVLRASGVQTPNYTSTYVFANDFPALLADAPAYDDTTDPLFKTRSVRGVCRVMCFSPKSNQHIGTMSEDQVARVIDEWMKQSVELSSKYEWVQIFENRGAMMGCSNPHSHCQIWASDFLPNEPRIKDANLLAYYTKNKRPLLADYLQRELAARVRLVYENDEWAIVVPYWAVWPFETIVLPKRQVERFVDLDAAQQRHLAAALIAIVSKYDNVFGCSFPYTMGWHGAPGCGGGGDSGKHWTFHGCYLPPLLRSATIKKFIVGYELLAQSQRDLTPERAAQLLREQSDIHYKLHKTSN